MVYYFMPHTKPPCDWLTSELYSEQSLYGRYIRPRIDLIGVKTYSNLNTLGIPSADFLFFKADAENHSTTIIAETITVIIPEEVRVNADEC